MDKIKQAVEVIDTIAARERTAILMCSLGKDSLVCLDLMYPKFDKIYCVFMYFVKGLEHIEHWVRWVQAKYPKIEFVQVPHWNLTYILKTGLYCVPQPKIKLMKLDSVVEAMRVRFNTHHVFLGMKKADSMNRRVMLMTYTGCENKGMVYPLAEWTQKDILFYMKIHKLPEPVRYSKKASSGVGMNLDFALWCREHYPQDLQKIYATFPLLERALFEYDHQIQVSQVKRIS